jgi:hypothetical protein
MNTGDVVYYRDKTGAHFGHLVERGYKWARVTVQEFDALAKAQREVEG